MWWKLSNWAKFQAIWKRFSGRPQAKGGIRYFFMTRPPNYFKPPSKYCCHPILKKKKRNMTPVSCWKNWCTHDNFLVNKRYLISRVHQVSQQLTGVVLCFLSLKTPKFGPDCTLGCLPCAYAPGTRFRKNNMKNVAPIEHFVRDLKVWLRGF